MAKIIRIVSRRQAHTGIACINERSIVVWEMPQRERLPRLSWKRCQMLSRCSGAKRTASPTTISSPMSAISSFLATGPLPPKAVPLNSKSFVPKMETSQLAYHWAVYQLGTNNA